MKNTIIIGLVAVAIGVGVVFKSIEKPAKDGIKVQTMPSKESYKAGDLIRVITRPDGGKCFVTANGFGGEDSECELPKNE